MQLVILSENHQPVTSSRTIAEVFEKRHDHVLRDIEALLGGIPNYGETFYKTTYIHPQNGQEYPEYLITRDGFTLLAMGFTGERALKWKVNYITAFNEMEAALNTPEVQMANGLFAAKTLLEQKDKLITEMKPKAAFFDAVADSKTAVAMNEVAKVLNIKGFGRNNLFQFLREKGILDDYNRPYQRYVDSGWFRLIEQHYTVNGEAKISFKTLVYQRGVEAIRRMLQKGASA